MDEEINELNSIFVNEDISTLFQTIVELNTGNIIGYEALSRGPEDSVLNMPKELFIAAEKYDKNYELEILCLKKALSNFSFADEKLFLNINLETIEDLVFKTLGVILLEHILNESGIPIDNVVLEICGKSVIEDYTRFQKNIAFYIRRGYKISMDNVGTDWSNLMQFIYINPEYLKVGIQLVHDIDKNEINQKKVLELMRLARMNNIKIIAEGIENEEEFEYLKSIGIKYGQGFYIQKPKSLGLDK